MLLAGRNVSLLGVVIQSLEIRAPKLNLSKIRLELLENLQTGKFDLKEANISHGLTLDKPLVLEEIIRRCYDNPGRKKFPDFPQSRGFGDKYSLDIEKESAEEDWIKRLKPELTKKFNARKIRLHDTERL